MQLNHWDIVVSSNNSGMNIEAIVDFEKDDKVYISEWWKNLSYPIRYVINKEWLRKKDKGKLVIPLEEMNNLMASIMRLVWADYSKEPSIDNLEIWQQLTYDWRNYKYAGDLDWQPVRDVEWYFCVLEEWEIDKLLWNKETVCQKIFGMSKDDIIVE